MRSVIDFLVQFVLAITGALGMAVLMAVAVALACAGAACCCAFAVRGWRRRPGR